MAELGGCWTEAPTPADGMANRAGDDGLCKHFTITEKASTRAFSLLKPFLALSHCQTGVNPTQIDVKLDCQCKEKKGQVVLRILC